MTARLTPLVIALLCFGGVAVAQTVQSINPQEVEQEAQTGRFRFPDGRVVTTRVYEVRYIDSVTGADGRPYILFRGRPCRDCDATAGLYIAPLTGDAITEASSALLDFPGRIVDGMREKTHTVIRAFYGPCLGTAPRVIVHSTPAVRGLRAGYTVASLDGTPPPVTPGDDPAVTIPALTRAVRAGTCREIAGEEQVTVPVRPALIPGR
jgi:hypothetical protein